jgi:hypothetical protein
MKSATPFFSRAAVCLTFAAHSAVFSGFAAAQDMVTPPSSSSVALSFADVADLSDAAPIVAQVRIRNIIPIKREGADGTPAGRKRLFVEADVTSLIRGESGIAPRVTYLYDAPVDPRGKLPKLKKASAILFARAASRPGELQLIAPDAQIAATPERLAQVKAVQAALVAPDAPPRILGVGDAFHVAGTITGEGETQIFLRAQNGDPVSLSILRRPGQEPRWAVALGEIVDEAARAPQPGTLLWYRLACSLPPALPPQSVRALGPQDAAAAREDYALVVAALGPCGRTRPRA